MGVARLTPGLSCSVTTTASHPFVIVAASEEWFQAWGFTEAIGKDISILNGDGYDKTASAALLATLQQPSAVPVRCTNVAKDGTLLSHDAVLTLKDGGIVCDSTNFAVASRPASYEAASGAAAPADEATVELGGIVPNEVVHTPADPNAHAELWESHAEELGACREREEELWSWHADLPSGSPTEERTYQTLEDLWVWDTSSLQDDASASAATGTTLVEFLSETLATSLPATAPPLVTGPETEARASMSLQQTDGKAMAAAAHVRVGVNGFGRIGRQVVRIVTLNQREAMQLCHINSTMDPEYMAYLLMHDSVHGKFPGTVEPVSKGSQVNGAEVSSAGLLINGRFVSVSCTRAAEDIPWKEVGVDYVCESTGAFLTEDKCSAHLKAGAKKVVISAPAKDDGVPTIVVGVNEHAYEPAKMHVVSNASCTTNGLAPLAKLVHEKFGIKQGLMTTVHATTASQATVDASSKKDWRAGRSAAANIIPASTGAAKAVAKCYPQLKGRLTGVAVRVPVVDVSMVDLTCELETPATYEEIKAEVKLASETYAKGIVGYTEELAVSSDFIGEECSSVFDANAGVMLNPTFVKLIAWYDNEWGYSTRLVDLIRIMAEKDRASAQP